MEEQQEPKLPTHRYNVVEYFFEDDSTYGSKRVVGAYPTLWQARQAAGAYIKANVVKKRKKYRDWVVQVKKEPIFWDIPDL